MADIKNKNELKRRIDLFIDDFSHEEYTINETFCKETMQMMREFIGRASHLLDCADAKIKKAKRTARVKAIDEVMEIVKKAYHNFSGYDLEFMTKYGNKNASQQAESYSTLMMYEIAGEFDDLLDCLEQLKGGAE